jgi:Zn-dependent peptidase ImmA (M78 family)/transcriptional regulator with XRE-family HTH domain
MDYGSAVLVTDPREPAATIRGRREILELEPNDFARAAGVALKKVQAAENPNTTSPIQDLEQIASALGLDEYQISAKRATDGDEGVPLRLRQIKRSRRDFSPAVVLKFCEAAWVTNRQALLSDWLGESGRLATLGFEPDSRYGDRAYPAWQFGYDLALATRKLLHFSENQPVYLRELVENRLRVPLIHLSLPQEIAGATVANGNARGIVVNTEGSNSNIWVNRATIAHELGHLLWDPDQSLKSLLVDTFTDVDEPVHIKHDPVEARANAFAIEFLAPRAPALEIFRGFPDKKAGLRAVMEHFGVSFTSARYQIWNALDRRVPLETFAVDNTDPTEDWEGKERLAVDFFKPSTVPESRRGYFAALVVRALKTNLISTDSAAMFLKCSKAEIGEAVTFIEQVYPGQ